jgi:hypothetical protein
MKRKSALPLTPYYQHQNPAKNGTSALCGPTPYLNRWKQTTKCKCRLSISLALYSAEVPFSRFISLRGAGCGCGCRATRPRRRPPRPPPVAGGGIGSFPAKDAAHRNGRAPGPPGARPIRTACQLIEKAGLGRWRRRWVGRCGAPGAAVAAQGIVRVDQGLAPGLGLGSASWIVARPDRARRGDPEVRRWPIAQGRDRRLAEIAGAPAHLLTQRRVRLPEDRLRLRCTWRWVRIWSWV